jgi:hypothetical protein
MFIDYCLLIISWYIFEMLFNCFISYLYMCVLKLTLGKIIFLQISFCFSASSVKRPDALVFVDLLFDNMPSGRVCTMSRLELFSFTAKHTLLFACSVMLCCVCFLSD